MKKPAREPFVGVLGPSAAVLVVGVLLWGNESFTGDRKKMKPWQRVYEQRRIQ
jgi:hypothetical protein